eukprot:GHVS01054425.1.p1 GENE.GHVS01054425.1~~GHVS01054425.1.p1  ORF type:complete len:504 (+),score=92.93 GHVS01054425.1:111-1622(+)
MGWLRLVAGGSLLVGSAVGDPTSFLSFGRNDGSGSVAEKVDDEAMDQKIDSFFEMFEQMSEGVDRNGSVLDDDSGPRRLDGSDLLGSGPEVASKMCELIPEEGQRKTCHTVIGVVSDPLLQKIAGYFTGNDADNKDRSEAEAMKLAEADVESVKARTRDVERVKETVAGDDATAVWDEGMKEEFAKAATLVTDVEADLTATVESPDLDEDAETLVKEMMATTVDGGVKGDEHSAASMLGGLQDPIYTFLECKGDEAECVADLTMHVQNFDAAGVEEEGSEDMDDTEDTEEEEEESPEPKVEETAQPIVAEVAETTPGVSEMASAGEVAVIEGPSGSKQGASAKEVLAVYMKKLVTVNSPEEGLTLLVDMLKDLKNNGLTGIEFKMMIAKFEHFRFLTPIVMGIYWTAKQAARAYNAAVNGLVTVLNGLVASLSKAYGQGNELVKKFLETGAYKTPKKAVVDCASCVHKVLSAVSLDGVKKYVGATGHMLFKSPLTGLTAGGGN